MRKPKSGVDTSAVSAAGKIGVVLTPEQIAANGSEHAHQAAIFQWIAIEGRLALADVDLLHAIPNGGDRSMAVGAAMKAEGVKRGVPDMMLPIPSMSYAGLYIELKVPGRERTAWGGRDPKQVEWHQRLRAKRYAVCTAYGWHAAVGVLRCYYRGDLQMRADGDALPVVAGLDSAAGVTTVVVTGVLEGDCKTLERVLVLDMFQRTT